MTIEEAAQIVRAKWKDIDGCRSCGWSPALYQFERLESYIDESDVAEGRVHFICLSDDASENGGHRGFHVYLRDETSAGGEHG